MGFDSLKPFSHRSHREYRDIKNKIKKHIKMYKSNYSERQKKVDIVCPAFSCKIPL
jgi:pyoverdine/dityrosine biosynthesis protein Dit1